MNGFTCPVEGCTKDLSRLQVMHFRSRHDCDPVEWVTEHYGSELKEKYATGVGSYAIATDYQWLSPDMVSDVVETRSQQRSVNGENNPMKRDEVAAEFVGEKNPAKQPEVREKLRKSSTGRMLSEEAKNKISRKNSGNVIDAEHRNAVAEAAAERDTSYMQTEEYSEALSESLKGREPTYPTPYEVDGISHVVRSSWEEEIAKLLIENDIQYRYEEEFQQSESSYYPDFVVGDVTIEVKGFSNERSVDKATAFMETHPSYTYVVVGDEIPCDVHIPWEDRTRLLEVVNDG